MSTSPWYPQPVVEPNQQFPSAGNGPTHDRIGPSFIPAYGPQKHSMTDKVRKYSRWFWPTVAAATALLVLLGLLLIVLPIFSSRSELKEAIRITIDLEGSTMSVSSSTQEDKNSALLDFIETKLENLKIDVTLRHSSTSDSYTVTLQTTTSFSVQDRVTLRDLQFILSDQGKVSIAMKQINDHHMSSLQFSIDPYTLSEMIRQLELYFYNIILSVLTLSESFEDISVTVVHLRNHITFRLILELNDFKQEQVFDVEFTYTNELAVSKAFYLLADEFSMTVELEVSDSDLMTPMKDYVAHILIDNDFHDFEITVNHLQDNDFRITLTRGTSSDSHTFTVPLVIVDLDEIRSDLVRLSEKIKQEEQENKMKCITTSAAYTQAHQRRQSLLQLVQSIVDDELYMINVEPTGWTWTITLSRASLQETVVVAASFRDPQFLGVSQVSVGEKFSAVLSSTGSLFMFGLGDYGQLGVWGSKSIPHVVLDNVKSVATGNYHTLVLLNNGEVWATGRNNHGQLALGHREDRAYFVRVLTTCNTYIVTEVYAGFDSSAATSGNGKYTCVWGRNDKQQMLDKHGDLLKPTHFWIWKEPVLKVAIGYDHLLVLPEKIVEIDLHLVRGLWSRGGNHWGQLGDETNTDRTTWRRVKRHGTDTITDLDEVYDISAGHF
ncbi:hypothetical protein GEMRC1_013673 [Eukaryota sp. GEM-RC1]